MIFEYYLYSINAYNFSYTYIVTVGSDIFEYEVDLTSHFPRYIFINNNYSDTMWYYYVSKSKSKPIGSITKIDIGCYINNSLLKVLIQNNTEYSLAKQYQVDKDNFILNKKNDNSRLYKTLYSFLIDHYKQKYIRKNKPAIKETCV